MCGILGVLGAAADAMSDADFERRLDRIVLRGPDGQGQHHERGVRMGMRRLAVIDLEAGEQPFTSAGGDVVAFQNGEIYNHRELQRDLEGRGYVFRSYCDTEVLAHGYDAWGIEGLLRRVDGMFAIAIFDRRERALHLARDRFGEKPLFFAVGTDSFAYGSDLRALRDLSFVDARVDPLALDRYMALHFVPGCQTIHRGIQRVLPGERLELNLDNFQVSTERYYRPRFDAVREHDAEELLSLLRGAVASRLESDVPIGVFLSGGLDSSLLTALAVEQHPAIKTFSMGFADPSRDESTESSLVAREFETSHHHYTFREDDFHTLIGDVVGALDEPLGDQACLPLFWLCREARKDVTVVLSGEGADESFGGYGYYRDGLFSRGVAQRLLDGPGNTTPSGFPLLTSAAEREELLGVGAGGGDFWEYTTIARVSDCRHGQQSRGLADALTWLPDDLLVKFDRMAMAHSLEGRAPYLMPGLFEYGLRLSEHDRLSKGVSKRALRSVASRVLPAAITDVKKRGFVLPMQQWLRSWFERVGPVATYVGERCPEGMDGERLARMIADDLDRGVKRERFLFAAVALLEWVGANRDALR